jgi:hypothetical protein
MEEQKIDKRKKEYKAQIRPTTEISKIESQPLFVPDRLEMLVKFGLKCKYARFHQPVPPSHNTEPVSEFSLENKQGKYIVEEMTYTTEGLVWKQKGETDIIPLANIIYCRLIV